MKARPRQIDNSKSFYAIESFEKFKQEEGQDNDLAVTQSIITPILLDASKEIKVPLPLPKHHQLDQQPQSPQPLKWIRPEFCHYKNEPYPDANKYELTDDNFKFLLNLNEKYTIQIQPDDFQRYIEVLDLKSGKDTILDFSSSLTMLTRELPSCITRLSENIQFDLHMYWKKAREDLKRPFLRSLMHPDFDDTNPHLAFRSRNPPQERKIYTRGRNPQTKSFVEMESISNRAVSIKEDLMRAQQLLQNVLAREKAFEIDRRITFLKFIKEVASLHHNTFNPPELTIWNKDCFLDLEIAAKHQKKETNCAVVNIVKNENIVKSDEIPLSKIYLLVKMDIEVWKRSEEHQMFRQDVITKLENDFKLITSKHRQTINASAIEQDILPSFNETSQMVRPRPIKQRIHEDLRDNKDYMNREYIEERRDSAAKFISTLYLEGRKLGLMIDKVMNQTETLSSFIPVRAEPQHQTQKQLPLASVNGTRESPREIPVAIQKVNLVQFLQVKMGQFVYRLPQNHREAQNLVNKKLGCLKFQQSDGLLKKYKLMQKRTEKLLHTADIDQMLHNYNEQFDDEKHDEEQFKMIKKRLKAFQSKFLGPALPSNGLFKYN